jgi:hypothetical protein
MRARMGTHGKVRDIGIISLLNFADTLHMNGRIARPNGHLW